MTHWQTLQEKEVQNKTKLKPLTHGQEVYMNAIETSTITLCTGPAGVGKSWVAIGVAAQMLKDERIDKIVLSRPTVECGRSMGFLPGDQMEKIAPYMLPLMDALHAFFLAKDVKELIKEGKIEIAPLSHMRGRTFDNSLMLLDEASNADYSELKMFLTRLGKNTRIVVCGDTKQSDLPSFQRNDFEEVVRRLWGHSSISIVQLTKSDIVRHPLIGDILDRLED